MSDEEEEKKKERPNEANETGVKNFTPSILCCRVFAHLILHCP